MTPQHYTLSENGWRFTFVHPVLHYSTKRNSIVGRTGFSRMSQGMWGKEVHRRCNEEVIGETLKSTRGYESKELNLQKKRVEGQSLKRIRWRKREKDQHLGWKTEWPFSIWDFSRVRSQYHQHPNISFLFIYYWMYSTMSSRSWPLSAFHKKAYYSFQMTIILSFSCRQ